MTRDCASPPRGCPRVGTPDTEAVGRLLDATRRPLQPRDGVVATRLFPKRMNVHQQNAAKLAELDVRTRQVYQASDTVELCKDAPPWVKADAAVWRARGGGPEPASLHGAECEQADELLGDKFFSDDCQARLPLAV